MDELGRKHCQACEGGVPPLGEDQARRYLAQVAGWELVEDGAAIARDFRFKNFHKTMAFVNAVAWIAHREDHHPDLEVGYKHCRVRYSTHAVAGLSENDFICAAKVNDLLGESE